MGTYTGAQGTVAGVQALISRTGYTGEDGFELYVAAEHASELWGRLMEVGGERGLTPIGLAARDTLRFEMGYCLYGNDIDDEKIGIIGHSEGAIVAPIVANRSDDVAFVVLLAGTGVNGEELLVMQLIAINRAMGVSEEVTQQRRHGLENA